ncbi:MAG: hypothetical protein GY774_16505 [Planctomycetes bacterium]|nr:hypothetical protein [Planctomycetota bacterium]
MPRTNTAEKARLDIETGETLFAMAALTDSGNNKKFTTGASLLSNRILADETDYSPQVFPDGIETGGKVTPDSTNDQVNVAALSCYLAGVKTSVAAAPGESITRAVTDPYRINSITVDSGGSIAVIAGTESTAFSETRAAAGGPPLIPVGSIEIAQVRTTSTTAALITADEIFDDVGQHKEKYDYPLWDEVPEDGDIKFLTALPLIHTGVIPKGVYAKVYEPIFAEVSLASEFVAPEKTHSQSSTQVYNATVGAKSDTIGQGSFNANLKDGITDALVKQKNELLWFKFFPDRFKAPYRLCQGYLGQAISYPAADNISGAFTITATEETVDRES